MDNLLVGDKSRFAIESCIARPFERLSQRALGYFLVHVGGQVYGVRSPEATLLACSFDCVSRRLARRGTHIASFGMEPSVEKLARAVHAVLYEDCAADCLYLGMSAEKLSNELSAHEILLAPDGDEAFDDGSHVLQFDQGEQVRLVAFRNSSEAATGVDSLAEMKMDAAEFYQVLENWRDQFEHAWRAALHRVEPV